MVTHNNCKNSTLYNIPNEILFLIETYVDVITFNNMHSLLSQLIAGNGLMIEARTYGLLIYHKYRQKTLYRSSVREQYSCDKNIFFVLADILRSAIPSLWTNFSYKR